MSLLVQVSDIAVCQGADTINLSIGTGDTVAVTAANDLVVFLAISSYIGSAPTITVKEGATSYTSIIQLTDTGSWPIFAIFRLTGVTAGTHTPVITVTNGVGLSYGQAKVAEYKPLGAVDKTNFAQGNSNAPSIVLPSSGTMGGPNDTVLSVLGGSGASSMSGMAFPFGSANNLFQDTGAVIQPCSFDSELLSSNAQITINYGTLGTAQPWDIVAVSFLPGSTTPVSMQGTATAVSADAGFLTSWASVVLTAPLYTGAGGVLDPNFWFDSKPTVGTTIYYDPTFITVLPDGEIVSTSNSCASVVQFFDSNNNLAWGMVVIQPTNVGYADPQSLATGALTSSFTLSGQAVAVSTGSGTLFTSAVLAAAAAAVSAATGALSGAVPATPSSPGGLFVANAADMADISNRLQFLMP